MAKASNGKRQAQARARWSKALVGWRRSGLPMQVWCAQQALSYGQFCKWRRRLEAESNTPGLTLIPVVASSVRSMLVLRLSGGLSIELAPGFDAALLAAVVRALGRE